VCKGGDGELNRTDNSTPRREWWFSVTIPVAAWTLNQTSTQKRKGRKKPQKKTTIVTWEIGNAGFILRPLRPLRLLRYLFGLVLHHHSCRGVDI